MKRLLTALAVLTFLLLSAIAPGLVTVVAAHSATSYDCETFTVVDAKAGWTIDLYSSTFSTPDRHFEITQDGRSTFGPIEPGGYSYQFVDGRGHGREHGQIGVQECPEGQIPSPTPTATPTSTPTPSATPTGTPTTEPSPAPTTTPTPPSQPTGSPSRPTGPPTDVSPDGATRAGDSGVPWGMVILAAGVFGFAFGIGQSLGGDIRRLRR